MFSGKKSITPYPEVNELIERLLKDVKRILKEKFVGIYIFGSLAINDFTPGHSDVDFLVVTSEKISEETFDDLKKMHTKLTASKIKWANILEGSYIPEKAVRSYDPDNSYHPSLRYDGHFDLEKHSADWIIVFHTIREYSI